MEARLPQQVVCHAVYAILGKHDNASFPQVGNHRRNNPSGRKVMGDRDDSLATPGIVTETMRRVHARSDHAAGMQGPATMVDR
jgi:hypothetical protein